MAKEVWYSHLFQNFPQFVVIHTVKGFGIVNKAEVDVFLELSCFFYINVGEGKGREGKVAQSCPTLCDPMDCSLPGSQSMGFSRQDYRSGLPFPSPESWGVGCYFCLSHLLICTTIFHNQADSNTYYFLQ